jgi:hypothetical protein
LVMSTTRAPRSQAIENRSAISKVSVVLFRTRIQF